MTIFAGINHSQSWVVYGIVLPTLMGLSWDNNGIILGYHWNIIYIYIYTHISLVCHWSCCCLPQAEGDELRSAAGSVCSHELSLRATSKIITSSWTWDWGMTLQPGITWEKRAQCRKVGCFFFGIYGFFHGVMGTGLEKPSQHAKICPMLKLTYFLHVKMISSQRYMHGSSFQSGEYIERSFWCLNFGKSSSFLKPMDMLYPTIKYLFKATLIKKREVTYFS